MSLCKEFFSYVIPSLLAFALSGVYSIVDGFFVGHSIGDAGLTTINIAYPVVAFLQAAGTGIGMGGAVHYSIRRAEGRQAEAELYAGGIMLLLLLSSIVSTVFFYCAIPYILQLLGAAGDILVLGTDYLEVIVLGSVFQIFGTGLAPLIRNMGGALYAMSIMVAGFLANILLDYVFVWVMDTGVVGAAIATVLGQAVTMLGGLIYFLRRSSGRPGMRALLPRRGTAGTMPGILKVGLSPFGITFSNNITVILMNRFLISYGGNQAAACYACIVYVIVVVYLLLQGVGDGCQPLVSRYYGVRDFQLMKKTRNLAYISGIAISAVCMVLLFLCRYQAGGLFGSSDSVRIETGNVLPYFIAGLPFFAFLRVTTSVFYATKRTAMSYVLVYIEPAFLLVLLLTLPPVLGLPGVWLGIPLSQGLTAAVALILPKLSRKTDDSR